MYYIVGLGNPGKEYDGTRHNIGFFVAEAYAKTASFSSFFSSGKYSGLVSEGAVVGNEVTVLLPHTFMNESGSAVQKLVPKNESSQLIVLYDDIDVPFGEIKVSFGRGDGGHNGIKSIIASLGTTDFIRIRIGIAQKSIWTGAYKRPKGDALASFVLGAFSKHEQAQLDTLCTRVNDAITMCITHGKEVAMTKYNQK